MCSSDLNNTQARTGIKKLKTESKKTLFQSLVEFDVKHALRHFETWALSSDAYLHSKMREALDKSGLPWSQIKKTVQFMMTSQALHAENVANYFLQKGGIRYNPDTYNFEVIDSEYSWVKMMNTIADLAKDYGVPYEQMELHAHTYFLARREQKLTQNNIDLKARVLDLLVKGEKKEANKLWKNKYVLVRMTPAQIKEGLELRNQIPELDQVVDQWNGVRKTVLDFLVTSGFYTRERAEDLMDAIEYVPFYTVLQLENREGPKEFTRGLVDRATDPKFKGSYDPVNNVFDNMERWISYSIRKGIGNKVAQNARIAMHENLPGQVSDRPLPPTAKHLKPGNTIAVWENGVLHKYHVEDPLMVHYFSGVQSVTLPLLNWSNKANRFFRGSIIYDPFFSAKQVMMDAYSAMFTSGVKNGFKIPILAVKEVIAKIGRAHV